MFFYTIRIKAAQHSGSPITQKHRSDFPAVDYA